MQGSRVLLGRGAGTGIRISLESTGSYTRKLIKACLSGKVPVVPLSVTG